MRKETLKSVVQKNQSTTILIGPEGDFRKRNCAGNRK
jgi:hypothetical protein